tara:strand:+ start:3961 stop:4263 length:303 start_codon:yes stop_codon:yes gene_type:complete
MEKIKVEKQMYWGNNNRQMTWADIKHLDLQDEDVINSAWVDDENFDYHGYWHNEITRMVEETDEQLQKRIKKAEQDNKWAKECRHESYLRLKKEFENERV